MESPNREHPPLQWDGSRRTFLGVVLGLASAVVGALLAVPVLRYILYPLMAKSDESDWAEACSIAVLSKGQAPLRRTIDLNQRDGWRESESQPVVYIISKGDNIEVLSAICPHLGCSVPWDPGRNEFVCPCHGGAFSADGSHLSGPPRRSLDTLETKESGGKLMVKYQYFRPDVSVKEVSS